MPTIHPSALVDSQAQLADDVQVGPGCIIDGPARVGQGTRLIANVHLHGEVVLGSNNLLYPFVCVGFEPQHRRFAGQTRGVVIGNNNVLRESVTVHCSFEMTHPTTLGDDNFLMTNAHVGHDAVIGSHCTLATGAVIGGHAVLEDHVNMGGNSGIHQFCRMGRLSFLGGMSAITSDQPPFTLATGINNVVGLNLVGLRRSGVSRAAIDDVQAAFSILYLERHTRPVAAQLIQNMIDANVPGKDLLVQLVQFISSSQRGLCPHAATASRQRITR